MALLQERPRCAAGVDRAPAVPASRRTRAQAVATQKKPLDVFLTRPTHGRPGDPLRARHCGCAVPMPDVEGGCMCGFWLKEIVDATWALHGPQSDEETVAHPRVAPALNVPFERLETADCAGWVGALRELGAVAA